MTAAGVASAMLRPERNREKESERRDGSQSPHEDIIGPIRLAGLNKKVAL